MKVDIVNGPNLNLLGKREPEIYGTKTLLDIEDDLRKFAERNLKELNLQLFFFQSNHEGAIIDHLQSLLHRGCDGLIINPGAYSHTSLALQDVLRVLPMLKIEVHLSHLFKRESVRQNLLTASACDSIMCGPSSVVYQSALWALGHHRSTNLVP